MKKREKMVGWYDPLQLVKTGIRVAISTVFGEFADRREALASAREIDEKALESVYDYSKEDNADFWFDFVADCGDGWNPTFAIARLLAKPELELEPGGDSLKRGQLLIMGGDEVYPTASREEYQARLFEPFEAAAKCAAWVPQPHVYVVPGNHDWYDGLSSFLGLFCRRRRGAGLTIDRPGRDFGGRRTQQTRSYFALKLPHGWWLWGADIQLSGYVDQPQIDFFTYVAEHWMEDGSKLILCTGQPSWSYVDQKDPDKAFKNFDYLMGVVGRPGKRHQLRVVLSGDSHHYSRYVEGQCHYITAGGGGAFLHPTHNLEAKQFRWTYPPPGEPKERPPYTRKFEIARNETTQKPAMFPDPETSRRLTWRNFLFAFLNWKFTLVVALFYGFFTWLLHAEAWRGSGSSLAAQLAKPHSFGEAICAYLNLMTVAPWPIGLLAVVCIGLYLMCDFPQPWKKIVGGMHALVHVVALVLVSCVLARLMPSMPELCLIAAIAIVAGVVSATIFGVYLLISLNGFNRHWNEAFSALRIQDYKNFLRLRIRPDKTLEIHAVGLRDVPREPRSGKLCRPDLSPHLIEKIVGIT
jgi:hypothetical protein